jgi:hypothetical protein
MSQYSDLAPHEFIDTILIVADIGGSDRDAAPLVEQETDAYIATHPGFVHARFQDGDSLPLHMARVYGYYGTAKYLLDKGADVNYVNPRTGETILTYVVERRAQLFPVPSEFIEYLRNHPAVVAMKNARSAKGFSSLGPKGLGPKSRRDPESIMSSFLTGEEGSVEQQMATLKKKATGTGGRRKTKKNKKQKQKRRKTRK